MTDDEEVLLTMSGWCRDVKVYECISAEELLSRFSEFALTRIWDGWDSPREIVSCTFGLQVPQEGKVRNIFLVIFFL